MSARSNARWVMTSQVFRILTQTLGLAILARILGPAEYGLMALVMTVVGFITMFRDAGMGTAVIQKAELERGHIASAAWLNLAQGFLIFGLLFLGADFLGHWFANPRMASVLRLLAWSFPLYGASSIQQALMERSSRFATMARIEIVSSAISFVAAILFAKSGYGVYSLALQTLIAAALTTVQLWIAGAASVFGIPKWKGFAEFLGFGGRLTLFSVVNYFSRNADNLLIGKYLGDVALGIYSMAYKIMLFPVQNLTFVAGRSLLPVLSRKQGNLREVWATYLKASSMIAMLAAPLFFLTITFRWEVVRVAFGDGWLAVPPLLLWLCLVGTIQVQMSLTGSVLIALGKTALHLRLGVLSAVTQVVAFVAGIHWGMEALVKLYLLSNIVNSVFVYPALFQSVKGNAGEYLRALMIPYASGLLLWSVFAFLRGQMVSLQLSPIAIVLVGGAGFMCAYLSLCWLFARSNCLDLLSMVKPGRQVEG